MAWAGQLAGGTVSHLRPVGISEGRPEQNPESTGLTEPSFLGSPDSKPEGC